MGRTTRPLEKELDETSYLHRLGDNADKDVAVFGRLVTPALKLDPTDWPVISLTPGSPYAVGIVGHGVKNEATILLSPADAAAKGAPVWTKIIDVDDDVTDLAVNGHDMWLKSHKDAAHYKVLHLDMDHPEIAKADVVQPNSDLVIKGIGAAKDGLYIHASKGGIESPCCGSPKARARRRKSRCRSRVRSMRCRTTCRTMAC